jgi:ABC-type phosphonate transport system ATPase subunit
MTPLEDFIGQDRAIRAIGFGLGVNKPGFNIFVTGLTGTGKTSIIKAFLKKLTGDPKTAAELPTPEDWCYVYNFADADRRWRLRSGAVGEGCSKPIWSSLSINLAARCEKNVRE